MSEKVPGIYAEGDDMQPLAEAISPYFDSENSRRNKRGVPFSQLPESLRKRVAEAFYPALWDELLPETRLKFARQNDLADEYRGLCDGWLQIIREKKAQQTAHPLLQCSEQRQDERWQMCIAAGLPMPMDTYAHLPRGIGRVAESIGITRQALRQDLNAYRERKFSK